MTDTKGSEIPEEKTAQQKEEPIDPNSTRERLRAWLHWMPMWMLVPLGLGPADGQTVDLSGIHSGYGGPHDDPHMDGGGYGDIGGGDMGGGMGGGF